MSKKGKGMRFDFLDLIQVKGYAKRKTHRGVVLQGNRSAFGDTYWIQWPDAVTIMHGDSIEPFGR